MGSVFYSSVDTRLARLLRSQTAAPVPEALFGVRKPVESRDTPTGRLSSAVFSQANVPKEHRL